MSISHRAFECLFKKIVATQMFFFLSQISRWMQKKVLGFLTFLWVVHGPPGGANAH